jgi:hypothetical protein
MFLVLVGAIVIPLTTKLDSTWADWADRSNRPIFPQEHNYSITIKCLAAFLLLCCLGVIYGVLTTLPIKPKDLAMVFYFPILVLPCLVVLSSKEIADNYVIPLCKLIFILFLIMMVVTFYSSLFNAISQHYLTTSKYGSKTYLEKNFSKFWFFYITYAVISGLFLCFIKANVIYFYQKMIKR